MLKTTIESLARVSRDQPLMYVEKFCRQFVCGECGGELTILYDRETGEHVATCGVDHSHQGYVRVKSYTEKYKAGELIHPSVANRIEDKLGGKRMTGKEIVKMDETWMLERIELSLKAWPQDMTADQKRIMAHVALRYGLDPLMEDVMPYKGRLYITLEGRRKKAVETGLYNGEPERPKKLSEREQIDLGFAKDDLVWEATLSRKGCDYPFYGYGVIHDKELKERSQRGGDAHPVLVAETAMMGIKRARHQALRNAFPEIMPEVGSGEVIEGQFKVLDDSTEALAKVEVEHGGGESKEEGNAQPNGDASPEDEDEVLHGEQPRPSSTSESIKGSVTPCPDHGEEYLEPSNFPDRSTGKAYWYCKTKVTRNKKQVWCGHKSFIE